MLSTQRVEQLTGALLLAGVASFLGHFVTFFVLRNDVATIALIFVYGLFVFLSAVGLYMTFRWYEPTLSLFGALAFGVHGLFIVLICAVMLAGLRFPVEFPATFGGDEGLRTGLTEEQALTTVTINAARVLAIDDRVGSLESGKDADFVIWSGNPLSQFTRAEQTWIDGRRYFSLEQDAALREQIQNERQQLIQAVLAAGEDDENDRTTDEGGTER